MLQFPYSSRDCRDGLPFVSLTDDAPEHGHTSIQSFPLGLYLQPGRRRIQNPLDLVYFLVAVPVYFSGSVEYVSTILSLSQTL